MKFSYLVVEAGVRYWEDATVNGVEDVGGCLIPLRRGDLWCPTIELATGRVMDWPLGTVAKIHYKVCDEGQYWLTSSKHRAKYRGDYVPDVLGVDGASYGDYVIMTVGADGIIKGWRGDIDLSEWVAEPHPNSEDDELARLRHALALQEEQNHADNARWGAEVADLKERLDQQRQRYREAVRAAGYRGDTSEHRDVVAALEGIARLAEGPKWHRSRDGGSCYGDTFSASPTNAAWHVCNTCGQHMPRGFGKVRG